MSGCKGHTEYIEMLDREELHSQCQFCVHWYDHKEFGGATIEPKIDIDFDNNDQPCFFCLNFEEEK
jgi:hypothetical protein